MESPSNITIIAPGVYMVSARGFSSLEVYVDDVLCGQSWGKLVACEFMVNAKAGDVIRVESPYGFRLDVRMLREEVVT